MSDMPGVQFIVEVELYHAVRLRMVIASWLMRLAFWVLGATTVSETPLPGE